MIFKMRYWMLLLAVTVVSLPLVALGYSPKFDVSDCPYFIRKLADDSAAEIRCGHLTVLEDRNDIESSRPIEVFVVRIAAREPAGNAPLIFLAGGPGSAVAWSVPLILESPLHQQYEIIALDQRGAGLSRPSLNCYERDDQTISSDVIWLRDCYRRLIGDGIALRSYNSANSARDIHDLLVALEISEANIYGLSYGSRIALTLARDLPQRVRSLILDGVLPLQVNRWDTLAVTGNQAFDRIFAACAAASACERAYPNLAEKFYQVIRNLNRAPVEIHREDVDYPVLTNGDDFAYDIFYRLYEKGSISYLPALIDAYFTGDFGYDPEEEARKRKGQARYTAHDPQANEYDLMAMEMLDIADIKRLFDHYRRLSADEWDELMAAIRYRMTYQPYQEYLGLPSLAETEQYLKALDTEARDLIEAEALGVFDHASEGTQLSFECAEEAHFNSREEIANQAAQLPGTVRRALVDWAIDGVSECQWWPAPRASRFENQPVSSAIPTLLLSGQFDPITPAEWGDEAAKYLMNSWHYVFPDLGHGALFAGAAPCVDAIALAFLANPARQPDAGCLAGLSTPDFYIRP